MSFELERKQAEEIRAATGTIIAQGLARISVLMAERKDFYIQESNEISEVLGKLEGFGQYRYYELEQAEKPDVFTLLEVPKPKQTPGVLADPEPDPELPPIFPSGDNFD